MTGIFRFFPVSAVVRFQICKTLCCEERQSSAADAISGRDGLKTTSKNISPAGLSRLNFSTPHVE